MTAIKILMLDLCNPFYWVFVTFSEMRGSQQIWICSMVALHPESFICCILCIHICITDERLMSAVIISMAGDEIMPVEDWLAIITPLWDHYTHLLVPSHQSQNYSNYRCRDFNRHSKSDRLPCSLLPASGISQGPNKYDCDIWCLSLCVYPAPPGLAALAVLWRITRSVSCYGAPGGVWGHNIGIISAAWCHSASHYIRTLAITDSDSGENSGGFVRNSHTSRNISHRLQFNCHLQKLIESIVYGPWARRNLLVTVGIILSIVLEHFDFSIIFPLWVRSR